MSNTLFIPTTLKVGYQKRSDTYSNKLAYVIYYDEKGKLRKEKSWTSWRDEKIKDNEFENVPTEGFILNRNGGGTRDYYYWNARAEFVRVWDPRGFEFEISIPNLLFILSEVGCTPGKGLDGEFVYGWNGADLVLLPTKSQDYQKSLAFTNKQSVKIDRKTMILGGTYTLKKDKENKPHIYLGRLSYLSYNYNGVAKHEMKDIFVVKDYSNKDEFVVKTISDLGECINDQCVDNYAELLTKYANSIYAVKFDKIEKVLINKGLSYSYKNSFINPDDISTDPKKVSKIKDMFFTYKDNRIDRVYCITDKKISSEYNLLNNTKYSRYSYGYRSQVVSSNEVNHYKVFIYLDDKKYEVFKLMKFFDYNTKNKTKKDLEKLAITE